MKTYTIYAWHGTLPPKLEAILDGAAVRSTERGYFWVYLGTLDEFAKLWPNSIMVDKDDCIFVTQHKNFGQR